MNGCFPKPKCSDPMVGNSEHDFINARQQSCGKVMFSQVCHSVDGRGWVSDNRSLLEWGWVSLIPGPFRGAMSSLGVPPPRSSGSHHMYNRQVGSMVPTEMLSCWLKRLHN